MPLKLLVGVVAFAALLVGILFWSSATGDTPVASTGAVGAAVAAAEAISPPAVAAGAAAPGDLDPGAAAGRLERSAATPAAAVASTARHLTVHGRLVDAQGLPRSGVELRAELLPRGDWSGSDVDHDFLPVSPELFESAGDGPRTTTGSDGSFRVMVPAPGRGFFTLAGDQLVFRGRPPQFSVRTTDVDLGDIVAVRASRITGTVLDQRGAPVEGVLVALQIGIFDSMRRRQVRSAADGTFALGGLRPGTWHLRTASSRFLPVEREIELSLEDQEERVTIVVAPGQAIAGQVVDDRGVGVAGMRVGSRRRQTVGSIDIERFAPDEAATTDASGYFVLSGLTGQEVAVRAFGPGHTAAQELHVPVGTGDLVLRVTRLAAIEGVLVTADGSPLAGSLVTARSQDSSGPQAAFGLSPAVPVDGMAPGLARRGASSSDADGIFRLDGVTPGTVTVEAVGKGHLPVVRSGIVVRPGERLSGLRLVAELGGTLRVLVVDPDGAPVAGATVTTRAPSPDDSSGPGPGFRTFSVGFASAFPGVAGGAANSTDDAGVVLLAGLPPGPIELRASHGAFGPSAPVVVPVPVAGLAEARIELRAPAFIEVEVVAAGGAAQPGANVLLLAEHEGLPSSTRATDERGVARFGPLAAGVYQVQLAAEVRPRRVGSVGSMELMLGAGSQGLRSTSRQVVVAAGETLSVEIVKPVLARVHGVVRGASGPMGDCRVELEADGGDPLGGPGSAYSAITDSIGCYVIDGVEPGNYVAAFGREGQVVKSTLALLVPAGATEVQQDLLAQTGRIEIQVVDGSGGTPLAGAEIRLERKVPGLPDTAPRRMVTFSITSVAEDDAESSMIELGVPRVITDSEGRAVVEDVPAGRYDLRISHPNFAPARCSDQFVVTGQTTDSGRVELGAAGRLRGRIVRDGQPVDVLALVQRRRAGESRWSDSEVVQRGRFLMSGLAPGRYDLQARQLGAAASAPGPIAVVEVGTGQVAEVDLEIPGR